MAKKKVKTVKKSRLGSPSEWSYTKWAVVLLVIGLASYLLFGYLPAERARDAERKEFAENKAQIEGIAAKIKAQYPPSEEKHEESCSYQSAKFDKGDLYCEVFVEWTYKNIGIDKANEIAQNGAKAAAVTLRPSSSYSVKEGQFVVSDMENSEQGLIADINNDPTGCLIAFIYDGGTESDQEMQVYISCNRASKAEYFPLQK